VFHDENAIAHKPFRRSLRQHKMFTEHLVSNFFDLVYRVADVDSFLEAVFAEHTLCASHSLDLGLDNELAIEVGPKLTPHNESLFG